MTTYEIAACTTLNASPEEVWSVLDNIPGWKDWMPATQNVRIDLLSHGSPRPGYRFRLSGGMVHATMEVTGYSPLERTIQFRLNLPPVSGETQCVVTPLEPGRCQLERVDRLFLPGPLVKFLDATQRSRFENLATDFMRSLKQAVGQKEPYKETYVGAPAA
ncbi:MAG: hypothetical protein HC884_07400 [Chloroflexaceae bacterium]|nr:hypothetical protein [Chloroflexaceae bacterium]